MGRENYVDAIHFNARGCRTLAERFGDAILRVTEGESFRSQQNKLDNLLKDFKEPQ
jgi:hypothetical protein